MDGYYVITFVTATLGLVGFRYFLKGTLAELQAASKGCWTVGYVDVAVETMKGD